MRTLPSFALAAALALGLAACGEPAPAEQDATTDLVGATTAPETGVPVTLPDTPVETVSVPETSATAEPQDPAVAQPTPQ